MSRISIIHPGIPYLVNAQKDVQDEYRDQLAGGFLYSER